jgi:hypothetical protein
MERRLKNSGKKFYYVLLIELLVLVVLGIVLITDWRAVSEVDVAVSDWQSDYIMYDETQGWYVDEGMVGVEESTDILCGPFISLRRGTYSVKIEYECEQNQSSCVYAGNGNHVKLKSGTAILSRNLDRVSYGFTVKDDVDNLEILIKYNGEGSFRIKNIAVSRTSVGMVRLIVYIGALFLCLNVCFLLRESIKKQRNLLLAIGGIILLSSLPLLTQGIGKGHDLDFHLMRIEGIAREIRYGNIPVRLSSLWLDGNGYPVSVYYGDLLLYVPAVLRLFYVPVVTAYKLYIVMINTGTAVITYLCMKDIFKKERVALLTSLLYCTASYRMVSIYVRCAVGEYSAMMFLPLIALAVYHIYREESSCERNALYLAIGMSGLIGTHILSAEMVVVILGLICIVFIRKTCRRNVIKTYLFAIVETCAISAYFLVPFLDYCINVPVEINSIVQSKEQLIQEFGVSLSEYFSFFRDIFSSGSVHENKELLLTPGPALLLILVVAVVCWVNGRGDKEIKFMATGAVFTLFLASDLFPWNYLAANFKLGNLLAQIQFPWRYISLAMVFLTLLTGRLLIRISADAGKVRGYGNILVGICIVMSCLFVSNYNDDARLVDYYDRAELSTFSVGSGEYLRQGTDRYMLSAEVYQENMREVTQEAVRGCYRKLHCIGSEKEGVVQVPVLNYRGYQVIDQNGVEYPIAQNYNNLIQFSVPAGFEGDIMIDFKEPWYWRTAEVISLAMIMALCIRKTFKMHINVVR